MGISVIQHACARLPQATAVACEHGVLALYTHYFYDVLKSDEKRILVALNVHGLPPDATIVPFTEVFDEEVQEVYRKIFAQRHGDDMALPTHIICVPWMQTLSLLNTRSVIHMRDGIAHIDYTQLAEWMRGRWAKGLSAWKEWDLLNVTAPISDQVMQQIVIDHPRRAWGGSESKYHELVGETEHNEVFKPLVERLKDDLFLPPFEAVDATDISIRALASIYRGVFARLKTYTPLLSNNATRARSDEAYEPTVVDDGSLQLEGYARIMPPCINTLYYGTLDQKKHFQHDDRHKFFLWAFVAGIPQNVVAEAWSAMLDGDASIYPRDRAMLMNNLDELYRKETVKEAEDNPSLYYGCPKMSEHCPFTDIEDIGDRKSACIGACSMPKDRWRAKYGKFWSPRTATRALKKVKA